MVSFSSSVINKSGKKFAPKAPVRRAAPAPAPAAPSRRSSIVRQTVAAPAAQSSATATNVAQERPPATGATSTSTVAPTDAVEIPESVLRAQPSTSTKSSTAIPIPQPRRKPSVSVPRPKVTAQKSTQLPYVARQTRRTSLPQPADAETLTERPDTGQVDVASAAVLPGPESAADAETTRISPSSRRRSVAEPDTRPTKRIKTSQQATSTRRLLSNADRHTAAPAPEAHPSDVPATLAPADGTSAPSSSATARRPSKARRKSTNQTAVSENGANESETAQRKRRSRKREPTPDGADLIEIAPAVVKMSDLCKDLRTGKMSKREAELRNMELAEQQRKLKAQEGGEDSSRGTPIKKNGEEASPSMEERLTETRPQAGPVMRIVNGEIVLDTASLQVDRHADAARLAGDLEDVVESSLTRRVNQATYGKRSKTESWDEELTDLFYRGLRTFGTDFMMISKMFPGRSRRQIKLKFNNEERRNPERINRTLLGPSETIDIAAYSEMTNTVFDDPKLVQQELDEEKKRIEEQHAKEKAAQEELLRNPEGVSGGVAESSDAQGPSGNAKGKGRSNKRQAAMKSLSGGTEEVIGSIDDIPLAR